MSYKKMFGFVDPITLGVLVALGVSGLTLTLVEPADKPATVSAEPAKADAPAPATSSVIEVERTAAR